MKTKLGYSLPRNEAYSNIPRMKYDIEPREIFYSRTGNLSQVTTLDKELADRFMDAADLRLDVLITDSGKKPEQSTVTVGSDVLAWRTIVPLGELTKIVLRPKRYRQTEIVQGQYRIQIHDQIIDDDIRRSGYQDREDYDRQYLARLKTEVKGGLVETLWWEKLGLRTQFINWYPYVMGMTAAVDLLITSERHLESLIMIVGPLIFVIHPLYAFMSNMAIQRYQQDTPDLLPPVHPRINPRDWKHAFMPIVPVDKWYKGRRFLAQHGEDLIIPKAAEFNLFFPSARHQ